MNHRKVPSLALALILQVVPVCRVVTTNPALATPTFAIITRCAAAIAALLGTVDAVSGASVPVYVAGVQSLLPLSPGVKTNISAKVGTPMVLRIVLGGSVGQQPQLDYYNASPLPPGLIINTNVNTNSVGGASTNYYIYGTPTQAGTWFPVRVSAGNLLYPTEAYTNILITITNATGTGTAPTFTTQPQPQSVSIGGTATFTAAASGSPTPTYQWQKNGANIGGATSATLTLSPVSSGDAAGYRVIAANSAGSATSVVATLTVLVPPPTIVTQPQSQTVSVGGAIALTVEATGSPTYQWQKNGENIAGAIAATFSVASAAVGDAGDYRVIASNAGGSVTSAVATVTVLVPPTISTQPQGLTVTVGSSATFEVVASGVPAPTYQWRLNSTPISGQTSATLVIPSAQLADAGDYTVEVSNPAGSIVSSVAHLSVESGGGPITLSGLTVIDGVASFDVDGPLGLPIVIWASGDFATWTAIGTNQVPTAHWRYTDTLPATGFIRSYRASRTAAGP